MADRGTIKPSNYAVIANICSNLHAIVHCKGTLAPGGHWQCKYSSTSEIWTCKDAKSKSVCIGREASPMSAFFGRLKISEIGAIDVIEQTSFFTVRLYNEKTCDIRRKGRRSLLHPTNNCHLRSKISGKLSNSTKTLIKSTNLYQVLCWNPWNICSQSLSQFRISI